MQDAMLNTPDELSDTVLEGLPVLSATPQMLVALLCTVPDLWPAFRGAPATTPALQIKQQAVAEIARTQHLPVKLLATAPLFDDIHVIEGQQNDYVMMPLSADPLYQDRDGFPVNRSVLGNLQRIQRSGLEFDNLYVVHEVPRGAVGPGTLGIESAIMPPPPRRLQQLSYDLGMAAGIAWQVAILPLMASIAVSGAMVGGALAAGAATMGAVTGGALARYDPMLLGVMVGRGRPVQTGEPAAWFYLGHWVYNAEE